MENTVNNANEFYSFDSKYSEETRTMHNKSSNIETMMGNETNENSQKLVVFLLQKYQDGLEESMKWVDSS